MPFGEIFTGAFRLIWRHKKLFLFTLIGLSLYALGLLVYQLAGVVWLGQYMNWMSGVMRNPGVNPERMMGEFFSGMASVWIGASIFLLLSLLSYFVSLVTTSGLILEADRARSGEPVAVGRGLRDGLGRAGHLFLVQMVWVLPGLLLSCGALIGFFALMAGTAAASGNGNDGASGLLGISWLTCICGSVCFGLLYAVFAGIFQPLMAQSAVAGRRGVGEAIREGWRLAREHLGAVIIFWLLAALTTIVVTIALQTITTLINLPLTGVWFAGMGRMMEAMRAGRTPELPGVSAPLYLLTSLVSLGVTLLAWLGLQTFVPVMWNGVYRHLVGAAPTGVSAVAVIEEPEAGVPVEPPPGDPGPD